jgi:hypothetical protein
MKSSNGFLIALLAISAYFLLKNQSNGNGSESSGSIFDNLSSMLGSLGTTLQDGVNSVMGSGNIPTVNSASGVNGTNSSKNQAQAAIDLTAATMDYNGSISIPFSGTQAGLLDKNFIITSTGQTAQLSSMDEIVAIASTQAYAKPTTLADGAVRPTFVSQSGSDDYSQYLSTHPDMASLYVKVNGLN